MKGILLAMTTTSALVGALLGAWIQDGQDPTPQVDSSIEILHYHDCHDVRTPVGWETHVSIAGGEYVDGLHVNDVLSALCPEIYHEGMTR